MQNLLSEMCVQTARLSRIQREIDILSAEARDVTTNLAMYASQCSTLRSAEPTTPQKEEKDE